MEYQPNGPQPLMYPLTLDLQYKVLSGRLETAGIGQTSSMGSGKLVFTGNQSIKSGARLEISILWPALLDDHVRLQLVIQGRAIDVAGKRITVCFAKHQFRTRSAPFPWAPRIVAMPDTHAGQQIPLRAHA